MHKYYTVSVPIAQPHFRRGVSPRVIAGCADEEARELAELKGRPLDELREIVGAFYRAVLVAPDGGSHADRRRPIERHRIVRFEADAAQERRGKR
jgi:hypothetical protein